MRAHIPCPDVCWLCLFSNSRARLQARKIWTRMLAILRKGHEAKGAFQCRRAGLLPELCSCTFYSKDRQRDEVTQRLGGGYGGVMGLQGPFECLI